MLDGKRFCGTRLSCFTKPPCLVLVNPVPDTLEIFNSHLVVLLPLSVRLLASKALSFTAILSPGNAYPVKLALRVSYQARIHCRLPS